MVFRADGNQAIGYGHFIRTLGIAGIINDAFDCIYATVQPTEYQLNEINKVCKELIVLSEANAPAEFLAYLDGSEIVVLDDYHISEEYQLQIRALGCKVVYIDDHNDKYYVCDALINNIPGFPEESFRKADYTWLYLGTDYALLRKEFFNKSLRQVTKDKSRVFLAFGGSDAYNISEKIVSYLHAISADLDIHLLVGDANPYQDKIRAEYKEVTIHKNLSAAQVADLIAVSGLAVIPASSLLNEVCAIGCKAIIGFFADNQVQPYRYFVDNKLAIGAGDYRELGFDDFREKYSEAITADFLVNNQEGRYRYQQEENLKNIFYNV